MNLYLAITILIYNDKLTHRYIKLEEDTNKNINKIKSQSYLFQERGKSLEKKALLLLRIDLL